MRLGYRQGKNEVLALADEIRQRLQHDSVCQIHRDLVAAGKIKTARTAFARHVKKYIQSVGEQSPAAGFVHSSSQSSRSQKSKQSVLPLAAPVARGVSTCPVSDEGRKAERKQDLAVTMACTLMEQRTG